MLKTVLPYLMPILIVGLIAWRARKSMAGRSVKPSQLWIRPLVITAIMLLVFATSPMPAPVGFAFFALAAAAGVGVGYLLARHQEFSIDPATGKITSRTSPVGVVLFVGLFAVRYAIKVAVTGGQAPDRMMAHSAEFVLYTDIGLFFALGVVVAQAWETWRRIKPLADAHAAGQAAQ